MQVRGSRLPAGRSSSTNGQSRRLSLVGVIATQLGTYFGYVFPAFGLPVLPWPLYNGILGTTFADGVNGLVNLDGTFVASLCHLG